jgi:hypothetical protein
LIRDSFESIIKVDNAKCDHFGPLITIKYTEFNFPLKNPTDDIAKTTLKVEMVFD